MCIKPPLRDLPHLGMTVEQLFECMLGRAARASTGAVHAYDPSAGCPPHLVGTLGTLDLLLYILAEPPEDSPQMQRTKGIHAPRPLHITRVQY